MIAEVLAGACSHARERDLRRLLGRFALIPLEAAVDFDGAVRICRQCRQAGVTPRGLVDCLISAVAMRSGAHLLAHDADLVRISRVMAMELDEASLR